MSEKQALQIARLALAHMQGLSLAPKDVVDKIHLLASTSNDSSYLTPVARLVSRQFRILTQSGRVTEESVAALAEGLAVLYRCA